MTLDSPGLPSPISHRRPGRLPDLLAARGHQLDPPKCHISRSYNMKWHAMDHGIPDMEDVITYHDGGGWKTTHKNGDEWDLSLDLPHEYHGDWQYGGS